jgi:hypothetical protein
VATSSDERFLARLLAALADTRLDAIMVGATAAVLQGVPVLSQDVDFLVRDTPGNRQKIAVLARSLGAAGPVPISELSNAVRLLRLPVQVDFLFDEIAGGLRFATLRSRALTVEVAGRRAKVATLADIIRSKEAAGRPKDLAQLPLMRDTLRVIDKRRGPG